ncbi:MAG: LON peptidase substrate-binding domain-containing protein [Myxococcaceae bacterium]|nr:LON peptidase substrate-binding domain-containing protein [Myxococcaceae bacterium]
MRDALERVKAAAHRLKVFPLPSAVLLPGGIMPLHIFEPRYKAMLKDAIDSDGVFAMAQVVPGQERELAGRPDLDPMLCVGVVSVHEHLEDGRSNLVLTGVCRARIVKELAQQKPYREVEAEVLPDAPYDGEEESTLQAALFELMARVPNEVGQRIAQVTTGAHGGALADLVVGSLIADPERRFEVLSQLDVPARLSAVTEDLLELISRIKPPKKPEGLLN